MSGLALALRQVRFESKSFWRNPPAAFFTFAFPLMFLFVFNAIFGSGDIETPTVTISGSQFYVPAIAAFSVISACYTNIAIGVAFARDQGLLKRIRGTPLPGWAFLFGRIAHAVVVAVLLVVIVTVAGTIFYSVDVPTSTMPALLVSLVIGAAAFSALGLAITAAIPNADAAPAVVNASILPLLFFSNIFIPLGREPAAWVDVVGDIFPVRHFADAIQAAYSPFTSGSGFDGTALLVLAAWGLAGAVIARLTFSWEPRR